MEKWRSGISLGKMNPTYHTSLLPPYDYPLDSSWGQRLHFAYQTISVLLCILPIKPPIWTPIINTFAVTCDVGLFQSCHHSMRGESGEKLPLESSVHSFSLGSLKRKSKKELFY